MTGPRARSRRSRSAGMRGGISYDGPQKGADASARRGDLTLRKTHYQTGEVSPSILLKMTEGLTFADEGGLVWSSAIAQERSEPDGKRLRNLRHPLRDD